MDTNPAPTHWLDIMPALDPRLMPDGVVLVLTDDERHAITATPYAPEHSDCFAMILDGPSQGNWIDKFWANGWRVDLDDPQGFAYALRTYIGMALLPDSGATMEHDRLAAMVNRSVWDDYVTDADRLALATALAEVSR